MKLLLYRRICKMLKAGILGCGSICQKRHAIEIDANESCELYGVYDPVTERAELVAKKYGAKVYKSAESLLEDENLDIVVVATPNKYHAAYSRGSLHQISIWPQSQETTRS